MATASETAPKRARKRGPPRDEEVPRPFVKTAGGKARLIPHLMRRAPEKFGRYWETFVGGGALFWHLKREGLLRGGAVLGDKNEKLVGAYRGIRGDVEAVLSSLRDYATMHRTLGKKLFERMRAAPPESDALMAAWFIYVNRAGFNGLWRVNRRGECNVPYGDGSPILVDEANLRACSRALQGVVLLDGDFEHPFAYQAGGAQPGDFVFFDCPYAPTSKTANFSGYTAGGFSEADQRRLAAFASELKHDGVHVLLTNSDAPLVRGLYPESFWRVERVEARGDALNSDPAKRGKVGELIIS